MKRPVWERIKSEIDAKGGLFVLLFDPDTIDIEKIGRSVREAEEAGVDLFLVGGSLVFSADFMLKAKKIKKEASVPVLLFPGSSMQITDGVDGVLFMSLISGRNPEYLIGEQVKASPIIRALGLETIPTGYILIDSGVQTSVSFMSGTIPIPADKPDILCAHGLAAQYLGMELLYLDAGSGARRSVSPSMVKALAECVEIKIFVGGGIKKPETASAMVESGASGVVIGNLFEKNWDKALLKAFAQAIHQKS